MYALTNDTLLVEVSPFDGFNVQPSDHIDLRVNSMLIPTTNFSSAFNEEFNDSLESHSNDFIICEHENFPTESYGIEPDSLENIENNKSAEEIAFDHSANSPKAEEILVPTKSNEINKITNKITESIFITNPNETERKNDSGEYDLKDIPGIY